MTRFRRVGTAIGGRGMTTPLRRADTSDPTAVGARRALSHSRSLLDGRRWGHLPRGQEMVSDSLIRVLQSLSTSALS